MTGSALREAVARSIAGLTDRAVSQIADKDRLIEDLGLDSMLAVNLVMAIEDRLGSPLPDGYESALEETRTVGDLVERLSEMFRSSAGEADPAFEPSV